MKTSGYVKKTILEKVPYGTLVCAYCYKHKPLFYVGKHDEQDDVCEDCLKSEFKICK